MDIFIAAAARVGATELGAFDSCLQEIGVGNQNLLYLSSVIPPGAALHTRAAPCSAEWGNRQYCVVAQSRTSHPGREVWAGLGWVQHPSDGRGLFAEAEGGSRQEVETLLHSTLLDMTSRRQGPWTSVETIITGTVCSGDPVCAVAAAVYRSEPW